MKRFFITAAIVAIFSIAAHAQIYPQKHPAIRDGQRAAQPGVAALAERSGG